MRIEEIEIDGAGYLLKIHVEKRNNVRASLRNSNINVRLPVSLGKKRSEEYVSRVIDELRKELRNNPALKPKQKNIREYRDGEALVVGADEYVLDIKRNNSKSGYAKIKDGAISIRLAEGLSAAEEREHISMLVGRCLGKKKQPELDKMARDLNEKHFGKEIKRVRLKNTKTRWGSCSKAGNINLSTRLLFAPRDVVEYVIVHELAHLVEMNHSQRFWNLVEKAVPDYKEKRKWLRHNCRELYF